MNVSAFIRSYMAKNQTAEAFLLHVVELIERQLKEWDEQYEIFVMLLQDYEISVKNKDNYYHTSISVEEIRALKKEDPFALDRQLWTELRKKGLPIKESKGNYLEHVFRKY